MKALIASIVLLFTSVASAGLLLEPQLGYVLSSKFNGTATLQYNGTTTTITPDYDASGVGYGARVGYQFLGFMGGLNYGKCSCSTDTTDYTTTNVGAFVGFNAPLLVRAWLAYNFSSESKSSKTSYKGNSKEIGAGFTGFPFLSLNLIYRIYDFDEVTTGGITYSSSNVNPKEIELAVSAPFNLF